MKERRPYEEWQYRRAMAMAETKHEDAIWNRGFQSGLLWGTIITSAVWIIMDRIT